MSIHVTHAGALTTLQDLGRPGYGHLGVSPSGAADRASLRLANALVGNDPRCAGLEVTLGGFAFTAGELLCCALTGAPAPAMLGGVRVGHMGPFYVEPGESLHLGLPAAGLRTYLAVAGGIAVEPVLGSRSTDTLAELGPPPVRAGDELPVGPATSRPVVDQAPVAPPSLAPLVLEFTPGPRSDWFSDTLDGTTWQVSPDTDRVGARLQGNPLARGRVGELTSEPVVRGSIQVPGDGQPLAFLSDHPVTGGYPVAGVLTPGACDLLAQARPGQRVDLKLRRAAA